MKRIRASMPSFTSFSLVISTFFLIASTLCAEFPVAKTRDAAVERFLRYVVIDTQSHEDIATVPSSIGQIQLAQLLKKEVTSLGLSDVRIDDHGYVYAVLPASGVRNPETIPTIGFISHIDTSNAVTEKQIHPKLHENYQGGDIKLPGNEYQVITSAKNPLLKKAIGATIITANGNSLLGADDKAGIAEIMTAMEYLIQHPEIPHGAIRIAFTPDEEVDKGPAGFDLKTFCASFAYTVDGSEEGELNDETFNAASAIVSFHGKNSHPGSAKDNMINSLYAASHFISAIPSDQRAEHTDERMGFIHPYEIKGSEEESSVKILLRDFENSGIESKKSLIRDLEKQTKNKFPQVNIDVAIEDTYKNMKVILASYPFVVDCALEAMKRAGVTPVRKPIRGGTDGADFSFMGLPCANIFSGAMNEHSMEEWVSANTMEKAVETIINIAIVSGESHSSAKRSD
ncbi:MAG: peptidase T [Candidatus Riflebacteria bacterium]|nr:peptidase T [Candidatus Riflebacteria bacterium]